MIIYECLITINPDLRAKTGPNNKNDKALRTNKLHK